MLFCNFGHFCKPCILNSVDITQLYYSRHPPKFNYNLHFICNHFYRFQLLFYAYQLWKITQRAMVRECIDN